VKYRTEPHKKNVQLGPDMVVHTCNTSYLESSQPRQKHKALSEKQKNKEGWGVAQVIEHLPSKFKTLSSISSTTKKKKSIIILGKEKILKIFFKVLWLICTPDL
jgi:hypothetical protein